MATVKPINLEQYLKKIQVALPDLSNALTELRISFLRKIYFAHVTTFPYSNFELRKIARQHPIQRDSLSFFSYKDMLSSQHDGYCFQTAALLFDALTQLGFKTELCAAHVLMGAAINDSEVLARPPTHLFLIVTINNDKFLLDPGMGSSAPRMPIIITGEDEPINQDGDVFKFYRANELYILERKTSQGWLRLMQTDLSPVSLHTAKMNLLKLQCHPSAIPIRDDKTVIGIITEQGRKSLIWDSQSKLLKFSKQEEGSSVQKVLASFEEGVQLLADEFDIHHVSAKDLKLHCTETVLPKPVRPWTVNFPLDAAELRTMEDNFTFKI
ncbi:arylamine N-acetyltransferase [Legionella feeleii]|uniref:Putative N-hydroxyarylamine O-acetyltransferase n=1 Tax=Legionella feeleii TaxID=453 RepID=A0A378IYZ6_9GAMM|nr:arylamine N-acetyltransferase [Legionella feeleii]STX39701.1 putative N-hydroxyarylamine O-acetyltransferase [Legionella feeleii]